MNAPAKVTESVGSRSATNRAQVLLEINNAIAAHLELGPLLKAISECLSRELPHDFAGLAIYDPDSSIARAWTGFLGGAPAFRFGRNRTD